MQARYYDPMIGRFYSNDQVGYTPQNPVHSFNRYMYVNNNPFKYFDPTGMFQERAQETPQETVDRLNENITKDYPDLADPNVTPVDDASILFFPSRVGGYVDDNEVIVELGGNDAADQSNILHERLHADEADFETNGSQNLYIWHEIFEVPVGQHDSEIPKFELKYFKYLRDPVNAKKPDINELKWRKKE